MKWLTIHAPILKIHNRSTFIMMMVFIMYAKLFFFNLKTTFTGMGPCLNRHIYSSAWEIMLYKKYLKRILVAKSTRKILHLGMGFSPLGSNKGHSHFILPPREMLISQFHPKCVLPSQHKVHFNLRYG